MIVARFRSPTFKAIAGTEAIFVSMSPEMGRVKTSHPTHMRFQMGYNMSQMGVAEMKGERMGYGIPERVLPRTRPMLLARTDPGCSQDHIGLEMNSILL